MTNCGVDSIIPYFLNFKKIYHISKNRWGGENTKKLFLDLYTDKYLAPLFSTNIAHLYNFHL